MHVVLIGATGAAGSRLLAELVRRGHTVTAIARNPARVPALPGVTARQGDVADQAGLAALLAGHDAVISSVRFLDTEPRILIDAVKAAGVPRYLVVGGAGSLEIAPGRKLVETPDFPAAYKAEALRGAAFLDALRAATELDWTFLSPSALFVPGERTGRFRLGDDALLVDAQGRSSISYEDFAVALVDELERPAHSRRRFTVGY
ncbi:NAD(P)-dependent oxidoreductase [Rhodovastum atsumiense]|uniref:NAD(P)-dependent oxidoreductase n=1 Tax=Rhodovastum atsumiense TaxID=504468 RepID=A0A5M6IPT2_9PROT|nr:NAD(P)-dependent oxidoreductase [Rhodovastum atsumiense]KAA5610294.1 NAD(P)-dependent oxidoreductase [Rhodovastum atsumiense]CAH2602218.1 NAD(P)-dependent oxidoreductase [Rhodovastum atsumiense]